jgi:hypothetical protein
LAERMGLMMIDILTEVALLQHKYNYHLNSYQYHRLYNRKNDNVVIMRFRKNIPSGYKDINLPLVVNAVVSGP